MIKDLYLLHHTIKWKTFKILQEKLTKDSGPVPVNGDKVLWRMLKDKKIYCYFCQEMKWDMGVGLEIPKCKKLIIIKSHKKPLK